MQHLFFEWNAVERKLKSKNLFLFLNYDGTLAPIKNSPEQAMLPIRSRVLLEKLTCLDSCKVAIVSGRSVADLKQMVKLRNVIYVGNHGFEIADSSASFKVRQSREVRYALWQVHESLKERLSEIKGVIIENKKYTLSVHYRMAAPEAFKTIETVVSGILLQAGIRNLLKYSYGKKVIEIKPSGDWNKGTAALHLMSIERRLSNSKILPVCIGDDITDEDMFYQFREYGITIRVEKPEQSEAAFYLDNVSEVQALLDHLVNIKTNHKPLNRRYIKK